MHHGCVQSIPAQAVAISSMASLSSHFGQLKRIRFMAAPRSAWFLWSPTSCPSSGAIRTPSIRSASCRAGSPTRQTSVPVCSWHPRLRWSSGDPDQVAEEAVHAAFAVYVDFPYVIVIFNALAILFLFGFRNLYRAVERLMMVEPVVRLVSGVEQPIPARLARGQCWHGQRGGKKGTSRGHGGNPSRTRCS